MREPGTAPDAPVVAYISYDEKPGIQAIGTNAADRPPVPGEHATVGRDHEYVRHGGIRVASTHELKQRPERYIDALNAEPVAFKRTYGIEDAIRV